MAIQIAGQKAAEKYFNMTLYKVEDVSKVSADGLSSARFADKSFCYVDDLIEVLIRMMNSDKGFTGPVNIGNPEEFTIKDLAEKVVAKVGGSSKVIYKKLPSDDPTQRKPDISLAKTKLGWEPKIKLDEGLDKTIAYFKTQINLFKKVA